MCAAIPESAPGDAAAATANLAEMMKPTARTKGVNIGTHLDIMRKFSETLLVTAGPNGALAKTVYAIDHRRTLYTHTARRPDPIFVVPLDSLHTHADEARRQAQRATVLVDGALQLLHTNWLPLFDAASPAAISPVPPADPLYRAAVEAWAAIESLNRWIAPRHFAELAGLVASTAAITDNLKTACEREATLIDGAHAGAGIPRCAAPVSAAVRSAAQALHLANLSLAAASPDIDALARYERSIAP